MCCAERPFGQQLEQVIRVMDLLTEEAMKIKEKGEVKFQLPKDSTVPASSSTSSSTTLPAAGKDTMVGFDDVLIQTMDIITRQQSGPRQIIPISGMGGIGKTTLARSLYETPYIVQNFDVRAWVTISQEYEIKDILSNLLTEFKVPIESMDESQLVLKIHQHLFGRRYLIVMDDVWNIDVCDRVQRFFPDNGNGSRIVITTRLSNIASLLGSCGLEMNLLDKQKSWELFRVKVFGQQDCPPGLEEIGREISRNCEGLPLSIVVIAGLLAKSNMTRKYWKHVANEVNSFISQAEDGRCPKILSLSYKNLPVHLKPCLLYIGIYPEDHEIKVSELVKLWVSEGFLKPNKSKTLEEVAEEYLTDLVDRNLIMVHQISSRGKIKRCKIHDLLGDLCLREAQREQFICFTRKKGIHLILPNQRRIVIDNFKKEQKDSDHFNNQLGATIPRSVRFNSGKISSSLRGCKLIRVLTSGEQYIFWVLCSGEEYDLNQITSNQVNLRYLHYFLVNKRFQFPSSINLLWNLQTIYVGEVDEMSKSFDIWKMKQLRHFSMIRSCWYGVNLPEAPPLIIDGGEEDTILKHLQTLKGIRNQTFSEAVVKRIPNIKKLRVIFGKLEKGKDYCLSNLQYLQKLESLRMELNKSFSSLSLVRIFPHSLKKLELTGSCRPWEDLSTIIDCLPNLQVLKLVGDAFIGEEWNPIEGQFLSLKYLELRCCGLKVWNAESIHFPVLEKLVLECMKNLEEIPQGIGEIPTLRSIKLKESSDSTVRSAIDILDEQESQGNYDIKIEVWLERFSTQKLETRDNLIVHDH